MSDVQLVWLNQGLLLSLVGFALFYLANAINIILDRCNVTNLNAVMPLSPQEPRVQLDIVIPARNEVAKIGACLTSLQQQTYPHFSVWVVDDRSEDGTGDVIDQIVLTDPRFHKLYGQSPPEGWVGKNYAIMQAVPHLTGDYHLFLDADTTLDPTVLARALRLVQDRQLDLLTLIPKIDCLTFWENVMLPTVFFMIGFRYPARYINDPT